MPTPSTISEAEEWPPNYVQIYAWRQAQVLKLKNKPDLVAGAFAYYASHPVEFINHWCDTYDPRNAGSGVSAKLPLVLFEKQADLVLFLHSLLVDQENGLVEKCRDMGATWVSVAFSVWLWLFWEGASVGWGSRKAQLVDKLGDPDSIFEKVRIILRSLPPFLVPEGFREDQHATFMRIINPVNGATITGEAGDDIGRGGRKLIYFKDESAHYERPEKIEAALADNTRTQIDISSVNGLGNVFHRRREAGVEWYPGAKVEKGKTRILVMEWQDHPAKSEDWYEKRRSRALEEGLLHKFAQEVDRDYSASVEGIIIPQEWVRAAVDAHIKLKWPESNVTGCGLDVGDDGVGGDGNAQSIRVGPVLRFLDEWGEIDGAKTARRAIDNALNFGGKMEVQYDCIGVGSAVKAEANNLAEQGVLPKNVHFVPWNAGASVLKPDSPVIEGDSESPLNKDFYANLKAQAWWELRNRFYRTFRAVNEGVNYHPDDMISIDSSLPLRFKLMKELSQPTASKGARMKLVVDKSPEGTRSPNLADCVVQNYWPVPRASNYSLDNSL